MLTSDLSMNKNSDNLQIRFILFLSGLKKWILFPVQSIMGKSGKASEFINKDIVDLLQKTSIPEEIKSLIINSNVMSNS